MGPRLGTENKTTIKAKVAPSLRDLYWAAGFLDGEGSFNLSAGSQRVRATQKDDDALRHLQGLFGGSVRQQFNKLRQKHYWHWAVHGSRARGVMLTLYPLLFSYRQSQIRKALS